MRTDAQENYDILAYGDNQVFLPTPKQQDILDVILDTKYRHSTIEERCEAIGCCRQTYYNAFMNPRFCAYYVSCVRARHTDMAGKMMARVYELGMKNDKNFLDRKLFLEFVGVVSDDKTINVNNKNLNVTLEKTPSEDLKVMLKQMLKDDPKLLEGINE